MIRAMGTDVCEPIQSIMSSPRYRQLVYVTDWRLRSGWWCERPRYRGAGNAWFFLVRGGIAARLHLGLCAGTLGNQQPLGWVEREAKPITFPRKCTTPRLSHPPNPRDRPRAGPSGGMRNGPTPAPVPRARV